MGVRKDRISVIFAFLQGPMSVRSGKISISEQIKNSRHSAIQESVHCILLVRKAISRFHFLVENWVYVQTAVRYLWPSEVDESLTNTVSSRSKRLADKKRQFDEQRKVCPKKLDFEDSIETCVDSSADTTSVNHDHRYFCSQEQATPKSNTNSSDTTLPKGKCSTACQTDLTA